MNTSHIDEIKKTVISELLSILGKFSTCRIALIHDLYGRFKLVVWPEKEQENRLVQLIKEKLADFSKLADTDSMWVSNKKASHLDKKVYDTVWNEGEPDVNEPRLRIVGRYRTHGGWVAPLLDPPWKKPGRQSSKEPPILTFYSFKGGVGRTTALAAFAVQRARAGERVAVIDADLDAPGIGSLLAADENGSTARWGVADYILEKKFDHIDFRDYYHACRRENVTGAGEILVIPAGRLDENYLWKLARLDIEPYANNPREHIFYRLLEDVRENLKPAWILIDVRAGLAVPAGVLAGGFAHLNVIFGTSSDQSWRGLKLIIERLGVQNIRAGRSQADLVLVQAMVPRDPDLAKKSREEFTERSRDEFTESYYAEISNDNMWGLEDIESSDAPHNPVSIQYDDRLTNYRQIDDIAQSLSTSKDYIILTERILKNFEGV